MKIRGLLSNEFETAVIVWRPSKSEGWIDFVTDGIVWAG